MLNEDLMAMIVERDNLRQAYRHVKAKAGAAGVDGMTVATFAAHARVHGPGIKATLEDGSYQPGAGRGVGLANPNGGERRLGIPTVQDRRIQPAVRQGLTPGFEPAFSAHSYGYRPGRSAHDAVQAAQAHLRAGYTWTVEVDISAFFDEIDHDILMRQVSAKVRDKRVLRLIGDYRRAPVHRDGRVEKRTRGTPQGGPLSPLLANRYLDVLDKEVERRGLNVCR
ncbi:MAG: reverse transcriptase domain-containing protein [Candidatus Competibacteraceae bacterium]